MRSSHVLLGAVTGIALGTHLGMPPAQTGACAALAALAAPIPDVDNRRWWQRTDRVVPDEALGHGGPMRHRGLLHWWGIPALAALPLAALGLHVNGVDVSWAGWAFLVGIASHLVGDFAFGQACPRQGRGPGIPLAPWWWHIGVGLDTGGPTEALARWTVLPAAVVWLVAVTAGAPLSWPVEAVAQLTHP